MRPLDCRGGKAGSGRSLLAAAARGATAAKQSPRNASERHPCPIYSRRETEALQVGRAGANSGRGHGNFVPPTATGEYGFDS